MPDWQKFSDQELIALAQKGEREAFEEIYRRYGEAIYRYLYAQVSHEQDAEDMTADVFLSLWRTLGQSRENERVPFYVYLYRIARNRLVDYYRRQRTRAGDTDSPEVGEQNAAPRAAPLVIAGMEVGDLHRYLLKLPPGLSHGIGLALSQRSERERDGPGDGQILRCCAGFATSRPGCLTGTDGKR